MPNCSPVDDASQPSASLDALIASLEAQESCPIVLVDPHGTIVFVSADYVSTTGYHRHDSVGHPLNGHLHPDDRGPWQTWLVGVDRPARTTAAARLRTRDGAWQRYAFEVEWRQAGGEQVGIVRLRLPGGGETDLTGAAGAPRCNVHQTILGLEPVLRRVAGQTVDVFYRLEATAVHVALTPFQLEQILVHLVSNARQAMPAGGVLRVGTGNHLTAAADSPAAMCRLTLTVSDTGSGLNPRVTPRIFEPFFTTKSERGHAGLGLTIVKRLVETAGGQVEVESVMGQGTTLLLHFPAITVGGGAANAGAQPCGQPQRQ